MIITNLDFLVFQFIARFKNPIDYRGASNAKYQGRKKTVDNRDICNVKKAHLKTEIKYMTGLKSVTVCQKLGSISIA